jgi:enoyl-CoA hydratase
MREVIVEQHGKVSLITINRAEKRNAISQDVALALQAAFQQFDASAQRVAVLTGAGDQAFCSGADLGQLPELWRCLPDIGFKTDKPIIAATAGWVVGGGLILAMLSDLLVAADNSRFSYPEARLGVTGGMIAGLAGRIPHKIAMEIMLLGRVIEASRAYDVGLANQVVPAGTQVAAALEMAHSLAESSPLVLKTLKRFVNRYVLPAGPAELQADIFRQLYEVQHSDDAQEGVRAFREKRAPQFTGY